MGELLIGFGLLIPQVDTNTALYLSTGAVVMSLILIQSSDRFTITVAASTLAGRFDSQPQANAAAAVIALLPIFVVFMCAQRAIRSGLTAGFGK